MISKVIKVYILILTISLNANIIIEDGTKDINRWNIVVGEASDIKKVYDDELNSSVIEFDGGGSYRLGASNGEKALNIEDKRFISWQMKVEVPYTIYIITNTKFGTRYVFYVSTPSRGLNHGLDNGIHHGLGKTTLSGRWIRVTRDLQRDIEDAEPENRLISINGFILNGGNGARVDNIIAYNPDEIVYLSKERKVPMLDINNSKYKILQWSFKDFGNPEIIETRGTIKDPKAFKFIVGVDTELGKRELIYTLGEDSLGLIDNNTIHHSLGDDRIIGSVWREDYPKNQLGMWQGVTRDLEEDIKDFEIDNRLTKVNYFKAQGEGIVKNVKMFSSVDMNITEDIKKSSAKSGCRRVNNSVGNSSIYNIIGVAYLTIIIFLYRRRRLI
jgi:hypothetical protein